LLAFLCLKKSWLEHVKVLWFTLLRSNKRFEHLLGFENSLTICTHARKHAPVNPNQETAGRCCWPPAPWARCFSLTISPWV
jgi:hypothetical protein